MSFEPSIQVVALQPQALEPPDLSFSALLKHFPGLAQAEAVCKTGSTVAGWGNSFSNIDLYAFSDKVLDLPIDEPTVAAKRYLALQAAEVQAAFAKWVRPESLVRVSQGPAPR